MLAWWERWSGRLEYELAELDRAGIPYERDDAAQRAGTIQLVVRPEVDGKRYDLVVVFPDFYPDVRFEVYADEIELARHQNPFAKNLCLIGRATEHWRPTDTLAVFLLDRLPVVLRTGQSHDAAAASGIEEEQAEPFSDYYQYVQPEIILVDSSWSLDPTVPAGKLLIGLEKSVVPIRGAVLEVQNRDGKVLACADDLLWQRYPESQRLAARWVRTSEPIHHEAGKDFLNAIAKDDARLFGLEWRRVDNGQIDVVGVVFPEETKRQQTSDGWVFLLRVQGTKFKKGGTGYFLIRAGYAGRDDMIARVPELFPLNKRRIAMIGLGALGMPSALGLARAGVGEICAIDSDIVDPGITPRWPFGLAVAGYPKVVVLEQFVAAHYPYTRVKPFQHRVGATRRPGVQNASEADRRILAEALDDADLVYDATAEAGLHPLLDRLCREREIPYVCVSATNGAWGGRVVRTRPGTGCWHCFLTLQDDGTIPSPIEAPNQWVQPVGCASPTFTGSGFDLETIAHTGVRLAVATLAGTTSDGYPDAAWDGAIADLRDGAGRPIPPRWQEFPLTLYPGCSGCGGK